MMTLRTKFMSKPSQATLGGGTTFLSNLATGVEEDAQAEGQEHLVKKTS